MKRMNYFIFSLLLFTLQNTFAQEIDLKAKAKELGYNHIIKYYHDKYYIYKNDLQGLLDINFKVLLPPIYSIAFKEGDDFLRLKNTEGFYSLYDMKENRMIFENINGISNSYKLIKNNQEKLIFEVNLNGNDSLYSSEGKFVTSLPNNYSVSMHGGPSVGVIVLWNSDRTNFLMIDDKGDKIAEFSYIFQPFENNDFFIVRNDNYKDGKTQIKYGIINHEGRFIYDLVYDKIFSEKEFIILRLDKKIEILDKNLHSIISSKSGIYAEIVEDSLFLIESPTKLWQLFDSSGSLLMEHKANKLEYYGKNLFRVTNDMNEVYFIDMNSVRVPHKEQ